jgi:hypothetical protein
LAIRRHHEPRSTHMNWFFLIHLDTKNIKIFKNSIELRKILKN